MKRSRKLVLLYIVISLATIGTFIPPIVSWVCALLGINVPALVILGSAEWVTMVSLVLTTYYGANVWQKHSLSRSSGGNGPSFNNDQGSGVQVSVDVDVDSDMDDEDETREALKEKMRR